MKNVSYAPIVAALVVLGTAPVFGGGFGIVERWRDPAFTGELSGRILVVGISTDREVRHRFEDKLVTHLRSKHEALTSYSIVPDLELMGRPGDVAKKLAEQDVSTILTVQLVPIADDATYEDWAASWAASRLTATTARATLEAALTASLARAPRWAVEVGLWDGASRRRVWSARTEARKRKAWRDGSGEMIASVIAALRDDRLLP